MIRTYMWVRTWEGCEKIWDYVRELRGIEIKQKFFTKIIKLYNNKFNIFFYFLSADNNNLDESNAVHFS